MYNIRFLFTLLTFVCLHTSSTFLNATVGYFQTGYGIRSLGMGGTAGANPQDSLVLATNPAGISFLNDRFDVGCAAFNPIRGYSYTIPEHTKINSQRDLFLLPHFGIKTSNNGCNAFGVAVYGRGLNTNYARDNALFGGTNLCQMLGMDLLQLMIAPTYSRAIRKNQSIGVSLVYGMQRIRFKGLPGLKPFSSSPHHVTGKGYDYTQGLGVRVGWMGEIFQGIKLGVAYTSKTWMTKVKKYKGLIAEHGRFDIPAEFTAGISWQPSDCLEIAFDYQYIFYRDIKALSHKIQRIGPGNLGTDKGAGFGWNNISVYKVGINYTLNPKWEVRAGYTYGEKVYPSSQIDPNIITPVVPRHHVSVGTSYWVSCRSQLDLVYIYAFQGNIRGKSAFGLGEVKEKMYQNFLALNYAYLF